MNRLKYVRNVILNSKFHTNSCALRVISGPTIGKDKRDKHQCLEAAMLFMDKQPQAVAAWGRRDAILSSDAHKPNVHGVPAIVIYEFNDKYEKIL